MSELSQTILAGTGQMASAAEALGRARSRRKAEKRIALEAVGESLRAAGRDLREFGSWREAKKAEAEEREVDDAYSLGLSTKGAHGSLIALEAVRPTTARAAKRRTELATKAQEMLQKENAYAVDAAQLHHIRTIDEERAEDRKLEAERRAERKRILLKTDAEDGPSDDAISDDPRFVTPLNPRDAAAFDQWRAANAPEDSGYDYDLVGAFYANERRDPASGHLSDKFKKPNHPTFSGQSNYAAGMPKRAGSWSTDGATYIPASGRGDSEDKEMRNLFAADAIEPKDFLSYREQKRKEREFNAKEANDKVELETKEAGKDRRVAVNRATQKDIATAQITSREKEGAAGRTSREGIAKSKLEAWKTNAENAIAARNRASSIQESFNNSRVEIAKDAGYRQWLRTSLEAEIKRLTLDRLVALSSGWNQDEDKDELLAAIDDETETVDGLLEDLRAFPEPPAAQPKAPPPLTPQDATKKSDAELMDILNK